jgi:hypothetical protein
MSEKIRKELRRFLQKNLPVQSVIATVKKVDETNFTCDVDPIDGGPTMHSVRLKPAVDESDSGFIAIPAAGSDVIVALVNNNDNYAYVTVFGKVKKYLIKTEADGVIELQGNELGGLVKIETLVEKINTLESKFNSHTHSGVTTGAGISGVPTMLIEPLTQRDELENTKVKHG